MYKIYDNQAENIPEVEDIARRWTMVLLGQRIPEVFGMLHTPSGWIQKAAIRGAGSSGLDPRKGVCMRKVAEGHSGYGGAGDSGTCPSATESRA